MHLKCPTTQMWREAEELAATRNTGGRLLSSSAKSMVPYFIRENVRGYIVYPGKAGGWIGDVVFNVPFGMPDRAGTPVATPFRTKREAKDSLVGMLAMAILNSMENVAPIGEFMFEFCDLAVPVEVERITEILALAQRESLEVMPSEARAMLAVAEAMLRADPDLSSETSRAICSAVDAACCVGIVRWPERQPMSPSGHAAASMMQ